LNGKWGAFNEQFNPVIQFVFEEIDRFVNGKTKAKLSNKWGVIDTFGNTIIPFDFERIDNFQNEIAAAKNDSKWGAIDINGNIIIPFVYDETFQFINGKAKVKKNNILGLIDITGNPIIEQHSKINDNLIIGQKFFKQGIQDGNGNVLIPFEYDKIIDSQNNSFIVLKDNSYSFMDYNGNNINSQRFDYIETYKNNYAIVKKDGKYGMIDNIYTTIIDLQYDELIFLGDNVIKIRKNEYWGIINNDNKILIPIKFKQIEKYKNGIANVKKFGVWEKTDSTGLIETKNKIELSSNVFMGTKFGKYGLENNEGKVLIPFKYDNISPYANGKAICYIYDKFKIEFNLTFKTMPYHCLANGSSKFGIFFEIPSLEKQPYHLDYDSDLDRQMIKVKGLLHINEIIKNNMKIEDFKVGKFYDLYIQFADEKKQRLSFSLNTLSQAKESKEDNNKVIENEQN